VIYVTTPRGIHTLKGARSMLKTRYGIEIEMTGITREKAARIAADFLQGTYQEGKNSRWPGLEIHV
jgi:hypothetical protein